MLRIKNLKCSYGNIMAVQGASLSVNNGELISIIGANGSGKSTLLLAICGLLTSWEGEIIFKEKNIKGLSPPSIVKSGISMVPEGRQIFSPLSVIDNLKMGAYTMYRKGMKKEVSDDLDMIMELFPILRERANQLAGTLSGGEQQMLAIGRALMARPQLLVLDEPSMGLAPKIVDMIFGIIKNLRKEGVTILLVEQNARAALKISDRGYVLETGKIVLQGSAEELLVDDDVKRAYLGRDYGDFYDGR
ncbi:leucine/isoleucine/valine transporter subunit; ATP-binding component of ABC superfamily [Desulfamplus magnetovallimortis]|uniref:Leucine/isoleucine/valine transporter subunit ATP-binding component of ABC superfamily n=1 Tax=Desulfamplus magnetovallimortis TaxID=1246637 RepID=A0A1W1HAB5_9BACT|nr:ABC transporter ATP-binding protein [Desulfamplus magnetovallimortis]SLM29386.1 leucine/isoleucine/valine transporter subunit; ATP-binding component of ABC superfamily [Desulfamplus magnetovallimortis]